IPDALPDPLVGLVVAAAEGDAASARRANRFVLSESKSSDVKPLLQKYSSYIFRNIMIVCTYPAATKEGRIAIVTDVGGGERWTRRCRQTSGIEADVAKSCGPDLPTLGSTPGSRARGDGG